MKIKALKSFCGTVTMSPSDEPREVADGLAEKLIAAGYAEKVEDKPAPDPKPEPEPPTPDEEPDKTPKPDDKPKKANKNAAE